MDCSSHLHSIEEVMSSANMSFISCCHLVVKLWQYSLTQRRIISHQTSNNKWYRLRSKLIWLLLLANKV